MEMQPGEPEQQQPEVRPCDACGAPMASGQDWCLECGTAAPGRLGSRPGMRAAATVVSLTLALVGGAVAASYAALDGDSQQEANRPAPPSGAPVAQVPPPGTIQSPAPSDALPPTTVPTVPTIPGITPGTTTPESSTTTPSVPTIPNIPSIPSIPNIPQTGGTPNSGSGSTPTVTTPQQNNSGNSGSGNSNNGSGDSGSGKETPTTTTPQRQEPVAISLAADAAGHYDPSNRATSKGEPKDAIDSDAKSAWHVTTSGAKDMATGLVIDLKSKRGVRVLELATSTPGFRAEIYAADSDELPPDILDTRWAHIRDRSRVDETAEKDKNVKGDGKERIVLGGGSVKYRYVLLWITTPPRSGTTVRISDLKLLG